MASKTMHFDVNWVYNASLYTDKNAATMPITPLNLVVEDTFLVAPKVKHFTCRVNTSSVFEYIPGQFITLHFESLGKKLRRSYSIANQPNQDNCVEFAAGYVEDGPGTQFLFNLKAGDTIEATGPYGRLILKENDPKRYVLVATSTGVTPYRAMLNELQTRLEKNTSLHVVIMQGVQTRADILYDKEFRQFATHPRVTFCTHLSREPSIDSTRHEQAGYVQSGFDALSLNKDEDMVYLCGNPAMIDDAFALLKTYDFEPQQVIREKYISGKS